ncbi:M23 family metallopeptidase [Thiohalocapsa marina]|uniref:M23 family metallopeptidase n=1 Tax=Thiohalocapsa marina TaxID=424902 RepID=A0A5M8FQC5_9GAMM|nr:M23 family metallopeptidase [Thiohalocapsa marina]
MNRRQIPLQKQRGYSSVILLVMVGIALAAGGLGFWLGKVRLAQPAAGGDFALQAPALMRAYPQPDPDPGSPSDSGGSLNTSIDVLAVRVAEMQAEILRMNALGRRLVEMAGLNADEFDFDNPPPAGGPDDLRARGNRMDEVAQDLAKVLAELDDRRSKLALLETLIMDRDLRGHTVPEGWPLKTGGVVTSKFGFRRHPITGRRSMHLGIDIAGRTGADIVAMADGLVTFSGRKSGYGNIVEVRHANGLETRYAHNLANVAKEGDLVRKGQVIAKLGSTGRSTGPHVHFEVRRNGEAIDPEQYLDLTQPSRLARL